MTHILLDLTHKRAARNPGRFTRSLIAVSIVGLGLLAAAVVAGLRPLLPFLVLFGVLVGAEWLVYQVIDQTRLFTIHGVGAV
jgi:hypothetical protein